MKIKRLFAGFFVTLVLITTALMAIITTSHRAEALESEKGYTAEDTWKAKYYATMLIDCLTYVDYDDDALMLMSAMEGRFEADSKSFWNNPKYATIDLTGNDATTCKDQNYGNGNQGLIAAAIDSFVKIRDKSNADVYTNNPEEEGVFDKTWDELSKDPDGYGKAVIFSILGMEAGEEYRKDSTYGSDYLDIARAYRDVRSEPTDRHHEWFLQWLPDDTKAAETINALLHRYNKAVSANSSLTTEEQFYRNLRSFQQCQIKYGSFPSANDKAYVYFPSFVKDSQGNTAIEKSMVAIGANVSSAKIKRYEMEWNSKGEPLKSNAEAKNTMEFDCSNDWAANNMWKTAYSIIQDAAKEFYGKCATQYADDVIEKKDYAIKIDQKIKNQKNQTIDNYNNSSKSELTFTEMDNKYGYESCLTENAKQNGGQANRYTCNTSYIKNFREEHNYDEMLEAASKKIEVSAPGASGNPTPSYSGQQGSCYDIAKTPLEKFQCNYKCLYGYSETAEPECKADIIVDYDNVHKAITDFVEFTNTNSDAYNKILAFEDIQNYLKSLDETGDKNKAKAQKKLDALVSPTLVSTAASNIGKSQPEEVEQILIGINEFVTKDKQESFKPRCGASEYVNSKIDKDFYEITGMSEFKYTNMAFEAEVANTEDIPTGGPGDGSGSISDRCEGASPLSWIICPAIKLIANGAEAVYDDQIDPMLQVQSNDLIQSPGGTYEAWQYAVSVANILLVILFIVVIVSQLTGYGIDNYGIKKILPKIIVVAILINLSYIICQLATDVSNILGSNIKSWLSGLVIRDSDGTVPTGWTVPGVIGNLLAFVGIASAGVVVAKTIKQKSVLESIAALLIPLLIIFLSILIAIVFFFILLGIRRAGIIVLVILAPLAIVCYALPNTKKYFTKWFNGFKALLVLYPICGLIVGASTLVTKVINANSDDFVMQLVSAAILVYPYFLIPKLVSKTIQSVTNLGEFVNGIGRGIKKGSSNALRNSDWAKNYQDKVKQMSEARQKQRTSAMMKKNVERSGRKIAATQEKIDEAIRQGKTEKAERLQAKQDREMMYSKASQDKGSALENEKNDARERAKYDLRQAQQGGGISYYDSILKRSEDLAKVRYDAEETKNFKEQYSNLGKDDLKKRLIASTNNNERSALSSLLLEKGFLQEYMDAIYDDENLDLDTMRSRDPKALSRFMEQLSTSGSDTLKGYSKHIGDVINDTRNPGRHIKSLKEWLNDTTNVSKKEDSFTGYLKNTYTTGNYLGKMAEDEIKFLNGHMDNTKPPVANIQRGEKKENEFISAIAGVVNAKSLIKEATTRSDKEMASINGMIQNKIKYMTANNRMSPTDAVEELIKNGELSANMLPSINDTTWDALAGIDRVHDTPADIDSKNAELRKSLGSLVTEAKAETKIWYNMSDKQRMRLDPTFKVDYNNVSAANFDSLIPNGADPITSAEAQTLRSNTKSEIDAYKASAAWASADVAKKNRLDPTWHLDSETTFGNMSAADFVAMLPNGADPRTSEAANTLRSMMADKLQAIKGTATWAAADATLKDYLDPNWRFDNAASFSTLTAADWDRMMPQNTMDPINSPAAQAIREQRADVIAAFKASAAWATADPALKTRVDPTWHETEQRDQAFTGSAQPGILNTIQTEATRAYNNSPDAYNDFIRKTGFNRENIFKLNTAMWDSYAGTGRAAETALREALNPIFESIPMQEWGKFDANVLDRIRPGWRNEVQKASTIGRTGKTLVDMNKIITDQVKNVIANNPTQYEQVIKDCRISDGDLHNMDASTILAYAGGSATVNGQPNPLLQQLRATLATQITALQNDPVRWSQTPIAKRNLLDPNWRQTHP